MKHLYVIIVLTLCTVGGAAGQGTVAPPSGQKTLSATMNVYVFPAKGQTSTQQSEDEIACYNFAVQNTGTDPFTLQKQSQQAKQQSDQATKQAQQVDKGSGAKGAVVGAAGGALVGAIAGDTGKGAAIGAGVGLIAGRRKGKQEEAQATSQAQSQGQQAQASIKDQEANFKKAFSVCLEAKNYMVKY